MTQNTEITDFIIEGLRNRKGHAITVVDLSEIENAGARRFIIAEGTSATQTAALADSVEEYLLDHGFGKPLGKIGTAAGEWIVMDYGDTWVHIFLPPTRARYNLEELWSDARITALPDLD